MELRPDLILTWDAVVAQFQDLVKYAARQQVENRGADNFVSAEDLYQEGMIKLYQCWEKWCVGHNKDMDEFGPIFRKALFRRVKQCAGTRKYNADIDDAAISIEDPNIPDATDKLQDSMNMEMLEDLLESDISRALLRELIEPSPRTLFEVWADIKRKEMLKSQGKRVNIPKDNTVRMKHIVRSLGITGKQYDIAIAEIRERARAIWND